MQIKPKTIFETWLSFDKGWSSKKFRSFKILRINFNCTTKITSKIIEGFSYCACREEQINSISKKETDKINSQNVQRSDTNINFRQGSAINRTLRSGQFRSSSDATKIDVIGEQVSAALINPKLLIIKAVEDSRSVSGTVYWRDILRHYSKNRQEFRKINEALNFGVAKICLLW